MGKVCIYSRVSTDGGKQDATYQNEGLIRVIIDHGYKMEDIDIFSEQISGYSRVEERFQLSKLMGIITENPSYYDCVYVSELSRIGRKPHQTLKILDDFNQLGQQVYINQLNNYTLHNGKVKNDTALLLSFYSAIADQEAQAFKYRSKLGIQKSIRDGKMGPGANYPYGYTKDEDGYMIVEPYEAQVVRDVFDLYLDGFGIQKISKILNSRNIPTRSHKSFPDKEFNGAVRKTGKQILWQDGQIYEMLRRQLYIGKRKFADMENLKCPEIIAIDKFNEVNRLLSTKSTKGNSVYIYLLKDILKCGKCGRNYYGRYKDAVGGDKVYKCSSTRSHYETCENSAINISFLESVALNFCTQILRIINLKNFSEDIKGIVAKEILVLEEENKLLVQAINAAENQIKQLNQGYLKGLFSDEEMATNKKNIIDEIDSLNKKLERCQVALLETKKERAYTSKKEYLASAENRSSLAKYFKNVFEKISVIIATKEYCIIDIKIPILNGFYFHFKLLLNLNYARKKKKRFIYKIVEVYILAKDELVPLTCRYTHSPKNLEVDEGKIKILNMKLILENYDKFIVDDSDKLERMPSGDVSPLLKKLPSALFQDVWYEVEESRKIHIK